LSKKIVIDTSALMNDENLLDKIVDIYDIIINIVVVCELDHLKTNIDFYTSHKAKKAIRQIEKYKNIINFDLKRVVAEGLKNSEVDNNYNFNDDIIVSTAYFHEAYLITKDLNLKIKAESLGVKCISIIEPTPYKGFKEITLTDEELADFYSNLTINTYNCLQNEYLITKDKEGNIIDKQKWDGEKYTTVYNKNIKTLAFGDKIKAKDVYQQLAIDSLMTNTITVLSGHAGSGKSLLSLMAAMYLIETGKYDRLVILTNPTKTKGSAEIGFYKGDALDKLMQNSIGNILTTKFGDRGSVDLMILQEKIKIVAMSDIRGMEVRDNEILYITECQNTSKELLKLCLSRASQNCKIILEGDYDSQVDSYIFEGNNNGIKRAIEVLKGEDIFGFVELQNIWRSKIATIVEKM